MQNQAKLNSIYFMYNLGHLNSLEKYIKMPTILTLINDS